MCLFLFVSCSYHVLCVILYCVLFRFTVILMGTRVFVDLLCLSSWCIVIVIALCLLLTMPKLGLHCVLLVFHLLFFKKNEPWHVILKQCGILTSVDSDEPV